MAKPSFAASISPLASDKNSLSEASASRGATLAIHSPNGMPVREFDQAPAPTEQIPQSGLNGDASQT